MLDDVSRECGPHPGGHGLEVAEDGGQRRAQLVAHVGHEVGARPFCLPCGRSRPRRAGRCTSVSSRSARRPRGPRTPWRTSARRFLDGSGRPLRPSARPTDGTASRGRFPTGSPRSAEHASERIVHLGEAPFVTDPATRSRCGMPAITSVDQSGTGADAWTRFASASRAHRPRRKTVVVQHLEIRIGLRRADVAPHPLARAIDAAAARSPASWDFARHHDAPVDRTGADSAARRPTQSRARTAHRVTKLLSPHRSLFAATTRAQP